LGDTEGWNLSHMPSREMPENQSLTIYSILRLVARVCCCLTPNLESGRLIIIDNYY
jgi:hypothetical protein